MTTMTWIFAAAIGYHRHPMRGLVIVSSLVVVLGLGGLSLGGCGGCNDNNNVGHLPDAPPGPDALAADAMPPEAVSLAVINHGVPAVGVAVYFLNADGSVAKAAVTDGNGIASAAITAGGSVTAIRPFTTPQPPAGKFTPDELRTFLGVKPGDHLVLSRAATDSVTVAFDAAAPDGGNFATTYQVLTTCGGGPSTINPGGSGNGSGNPDPGGTLDLQNCHGAADIAVVASGGGLKTPQGLYHANATLPPNGNVMVSLRNDAYAVLTDITFMYTNMPDATITVLHSPILGNGFLGPYSTMAGDSATITEAAVPATMEVVDSSLIVNNQHEVVDWGPYGTSYALDVGAALLREVTGGPTYDLATGKISWTEATSGATPSLTIAGILVRRTEPMLAKWHWEIVAPYSPSGIVLPHLPTDIMNWMPLPTDDPVTLDPIQNVQVTGGYDAVRAHILDIHDELGPTGYVIGNAGRAVIATSTVQVR
jgi:hypothetical protein